MWLNIYPDASLMHLPIIGSDFLNIYPSSNNCNYKGYKFEAKWLLHDDFLNIVKYVWTLFFATSAPPPPPPRPSTYQLNRKMYLLQTATKSWIMSVSTINIIILIIYQ